jgi:hypothetical protein
MAVGHISEKVLDGDRRPFFEQFHGDVPHRRGDHCHRVSGGRFEHSGSLRGGRWVGGSLEEKNQKKGRHAPTIDEAIGR